jgi:serine/threonine protein kinase
VYKVEIEGKPFAVKRIRRHTGSQLTFTQLDNLVNEVDLLSKMEHDRVIKLYGLYRTEDYYHLVLEYCNGGDLRSFLRHYNN